MPHTMTTCPFCGCGCGLYLQGDGTKLSGVVASPAHPVGQGRLCLKGWHAHDIVASPQRLRAPLIKRGERLREASWKEALDLVATKLGEIRARGAGTIGLLGSARATNEENFLLSKLARGTLGTNNVDFCARLEALPQFFDLPQYRHLTSPTATLEHIARADLIVLWQADVAQEHPAAAARVLRAAREGATVLEVGARSGQVGGAATLRLRPLPGTEALLAAGLLHVALAQRAGLPREGKALAASVDGATPERMEAVTGVPAEQVRAAGAALAAAVRPLILYSRALTSCTRGADVLVSLSAFHHLANAGDWPGLLWLSRQSNFHGARDMGVVPHFLSGHQPVSDPEVRRKFEHAWGSALPTEPGLPAWEMLGAVRGLFVLSDDPLQSLPEPARARQALAELDFLAVMDLYLSPTAQLADVVLPGASFAEKDGTVTNAEGRVQRVRRAVPSPGEARAEWEVLGELSGRLGRPMDYASPAAIMEEIALLTPCYSEVSYRGLETSAEVRCARGDLTPEEAASLVAGDVEASLGPPEEATPAAAGEVAMTLVVDYAQGEWAEDAAVVCSAALRRELSRDGRAGPPTVAISPEDAERCGVQEGQRVLLGSRAGEAQAQVHVDASVRPRVLVLPFRAREAAAPVLAVTSDGETGVPVLAPCAVTIRKQ
jgi:formate dehydrogenase alpha subunit